MAKCAKEKNRCGARVEVRDCSPSRVLLSMPVCGCTQLPVLFYATVYYAPLTLLLAEEFFCAQTKQRGACRAAQRRFRERQKGLITDLKVRAETLQKENEAQRRRIAELEKENSVRRPCQVLTQPYYACCCPSPLQCNDLCRSMASLSKALAKAPKPHYLPLLFGHQPMCLYRVLLARVTPAHMLVAVHAQVLKDIMHRGSPDKAAASAAAAVPGGVAAEGALHPARPSDLQ